jgi:sugar phosphate isomerase/epimerase
MTTPIGFASGCFTATDYDLALAVGRAHRTSAFELGCYQTSWLPLACGRARQVAAGSWPWLSVHTPRFAPRQEQRVAEQLGELGLPLVLHADRLRAPAAWRPLGAAVLVENIAEPGRRGSTADTLDEVFAALPDARFCLDVSHAYAVGGRPLVVDLARRYPDRLAQLHVGCTGVPERPGEPLPADADLVRLALDAADRTLPVIIERPWADPWAESVGTAVAAIRAVVAGRSGVRT